MAEETQDVTPQSVQAVIDGSGAPLAVRKQAWDAFATSKSPKEFKTSMDKLLIPKKLKSQLWDMKATVMNQGEVPDPPDMTNRVKLKGMHTATGGTGEPNTILGGMYNVGMGTATGTVRLLEPSAQDKFEQGGNVVEKLAKRNPATRMVRDYSQSAERLSPQLGEQRKKGETAKSIVTGAAMFNPFAAGTVADINDMESEGRNREAIGTGIASIIGLLAGKGRGRKNPFNLREFSGVGDATKNYRANKLTYAIGGERDIARVVVPIIDEEVKKSGGVKTIKDLGDRLDGALSARETKFNVGLQKLMQSNQPYALTDSVRRILLDAANDLPTKAVTERAALRREANKYYGQKSFSELDKERKYEGTLASQLYGASASDQMAAAHAGTAKNMHKIVADAVRDLLYDEMQSRLGGEWSKLKKEQSHLIKIKDQLEKHITKMADAEGIMKGAPLSEKVGLSVHGGTHGMTPRAHIRGLLGGGPEKAANTAAKKAFGGSRVNIPDIDLKTGQRMSRAVTPAHARRAVVLAMPITRLSEDEK